MWTPIKPKFKKECILLTASKSITKSDVWYYSSWLIQKVNVDGQWYWGRCTLDGKEWGDINDLSADLYRVINIPIKQIEAHDFVDRIFIDKP